MQNGFDSRGRWTGAIGPATLSGLSALSGGFGAFAGIGVNGRSQPEGTTLVASTAGRTARASSTPSPTAQKWVKNRRGSSAR